MPKPAPCPDGEAFRQGMATRRAVLGDRHVDQAQARTTAFDADFQRFITETAWGSVWSRPGLTKRERSLITMAILAARGQDDELALHARATANTGASLDDMKELLLHVAVYAGVPAANRAIGVVKQALDDVACGPKTSGEGST